MPVTTIGAYNLTHACRTTNLYVLLHYIVQDINTRTGERILNRALEAFSIAGSIISMVGLILTIITMAGFR